MNAPHTTPTTSNVIPFPKPPAPKEPAGQFDVLEQLLHQLFGNKYPLPNRFAGTVAVIDTESMQP